MNKCEACQEYPLAWGNLCRDCADLAFSDVEGASWVHGMIMARKYPMPDDNPWLSDPDAKVGA